MIELVDSAIVFQNRQERKTIANFCSAALHFDFNFHVERLAVLIDWYNTYNFYVCVYVCFISIWRNIALYRHIVYLKPNEKPNDKFLHTVW